MNVGSMTLLRDWLLTQCSHFFINNFIYNIFSSHPSVNYINIIMPVTDETYWEK